MMDDRRASCDIVDSMGAESSVSAYDWVFLHKRKPVVENPIKTE